MVSNSLQTSKPFLGFVVATKPFLVTDVTIQNGFRTAAFIHSTSTSSSTIDMNVTDQSNLYSNDSLKQLESLLAYIEIADDQLTAAEFVDIHSSIPTYNEWDDDAHLNELIELAREDESEQEEKVSLYI
ncbi:unnamed protein product [Adineta steineri]|uniref:Uncharacterized protein n=1 Tax=Adineta steineri TaxID=433720 RepID=A0A818Y3Q3_9BILA|nr:unnamed protein product [Adineta steineri]CAF3749198.1 unnamed protein product [Adineta steineri]